LHLDLPVERQAGRSFAGPQAPRMFHAPHLVFMKYQLFTYESGSGTSETQAGIAVGQNRFDLSSLASHLGLDRLAGRSIDQLLEDWAASRQSLHDMARRVAAGDAGTIALLANETIRFRAPLERPGVIYAAGANYRDHVEAMGRAFNMKLVLDPKAEGVDPWHFIKAGRGTLSGHRDRIAFPAHTKKLDWEAELAVVIGRRASGVSVAQALDCVAGYTCANDLSARDNLVRPLVDPSSPFRFDWIGHKCFAGACPLGPFLTPAEFVDSPERLSIRLWLNGSLQQDSNTSNHLYSVAEQIAYLSSRLDLYPGDVILTGTPAGVGMETGTFLRSGDVMRVAIEGLGELETTIV